MSHSNFKFLQGVNDFLFSIARAAEKNYPDDPNTTLVKLRIFGESTDSETYHTLEADGRSFAEHSHEQLTAKLQRIISHAQFSRDKSKTLQAHIKHIDELCQSAAGCDFTHLAKLLKEKGPKWSAEVFNQASNLVSHLEHLKQEINQLRDMPIYLTQSILAKAFRGELVAQDPNDEPADKLLERIAKARIEAEQLAKAAKKTAKQAVKQG